MRPLWRPAVLAAVLSAAGCVSVEPTLSNAAVTTNFLRIAFGAEYVQVVGPRLSKWTESELGVFLEAPGLPPERLAAVQASLARHLLRLERLTGLRFRFPGSTVAEGSHIIVFVLPRTALEQELRTTFDLDPKAVACFGGAFRGNDRPGGIRGALIGIPDDLPPNDIDACLVEEVTQALGLFMDDDRVRPSVFNDDDAFRDLTWQDELMLRVLYDRRLAPGMTRAEAAPVVRRLVEELRSGLGFASQRPYPSSLGD